MNRFLNKKYGIIVGIAVVIIVAAIIITTTFSNALTLDEAKEIAKKYVPATATFVNSEEEENKFEVYFHDTAAREAYEVEISKETKAVKKFESQLDNDLGSKMVKLSEAEIKALVMAKYPDITGVVINLNLDDGLYEYEVVFKANDFYGSMDINPETGAILECGIKYGTAVTVPTTAGEKGDFWTTQQAVEAAVRLLGGGKVKDLDLEKIDGKYQYELEVIKDGMEYEMLVDAKTGKVTEKGSHKNHLNTDATAGVTQQVNNKGTGISLDKAKGIVLAKISGAKISNLKLENEDGKLVYEGKAKKGDYEYDFEIDATTGVITSWDREIIDKDDAKDDDDNDKDDDKDDDNDTDDDKYHKPNSGNDKYNKDDDDDDKDDDDADKYQQDNKPGKSEDKDTNVPSKPSVLDNNNDSDSNDSNDNSDSHDNSDSNDSDSSSSSDNSSDSSSDND